MGLTPDDIQAVRFHTTRLRAGYRMSEVDRFLDEVASSIEKLREQLQRAEDSEVVWRAQAEQLQIRLTAREAELSSRGHDTIPLPRTSAADIEAVRQRVRATLVEQLRLLDEIAPSATSQG